MDLTPERILQVFQKQGRRPVSLRELLDALNLHRGSQRLLTSMLMALVREGKLIRLRNKYFILPDTARRASGHLQVTRRGHAYLLGAANVSGDLFIHRSNLASAVDGDRVEVEVVPGRKDAEEGRVLRVLERAHETLVGQFHRSGPRSGTVVPRNLKIARWVELDQTPPESELPDGAWLLLRVLDWTDQMEEPLRAEVEEILGLPGERGLPVLVMLRDWGIDPEFDEAVLAQVDAFALPDEQIRLAKGSGSDPMEHRRDLRDVELVTIDPATAKDFDDAVSVERLESGRWRLGVHIADVSHYVRPGTKLDRVALERGTSIYPVDRVVPMLPERLSNDLCSLRPNEDRFAMSIFMEIDQRGEVHRSDLCESLIHSRRRLSYRQVQDYFDADEAGREGMDCHPQGAMLLELRELARVLTRMRMQRGALDLDMPEAGLRCNEAGDVVEVYREERLDSMRLIEECMLIANESVARLMRREKLPCLYRIHDVPDPGALEKLRAPLDVLGIQLPRKIEPSPEVYQPIVDRLQRRDGGHIGQRLLLRSLMRAQYWPQNRGHFGLASECYCHFTSPIRRYPDLLVHRVLRDWLRGRTGEPDWGEELREGLEAIANQSNLTADRAQDIEREATEIKALEYMKDQLGNIYEGWVSGIMRRGFFVELVEVPVEGFVSARTLEDDFYRPDEHYVRLVGDRHGRHFTLGRRVKVRVVRINEEEGEMDLELVSESRGRKQQPQGKRRARRKRKA